MVETKTCPKCGETKPAQEGFGLVREGARTPRWNSHCRDCRNAGYRDTRLRAQYGLEPGEYETLLEAQGGVCAICKRPPARYRLSVDHDHKTGLTRGLLCSRCNRLLGWAFDKAETLTAGAAYLLAPPVSALGRVVQGRTGRVGKKVKRKGTRRRLTSGRGTRYDNPTGNTRQKKESP